MKKLCFLLLAITTPLFSQDYAENGPLFAGTLLSFEAKNLKPGRFAIEEYGLVLRNYGHYNQHSTLERDLNRHRYELISYLKSGLSDFLDFNILIDAVYTHAKHKNACSLADTLVLLGIQLAEQQKNHWVPYVRLLIGENLPTGKYDRLDPNKNGIDVSGAGTFETFFILSMEKLFCRYSNHPYTINLNVYYTLPTTTQIRGLSIYGGGVGTRGSIKPGNQFIVNIAFEYSLTHHLILGTDIRYEHKNASSFLPPTSFAPSAGLPSSERLSVAPCLEYNLNPHFGTTGGLWFTVNGRNSLAFLSGIFAAYWYF